MHDFNFCQNQPTLLYSDQNVSTPSLSHSLYQVMFAQPQRSLVSKFIFNGGRPSVSVHVILVNSITKRSGRANLGNFRSRHDINERVLLLRWWEMEKKSTDESRGGSGRSFPGKSTPKYLG